VNEISEGLMKVEEKERLEELINLKEMEKNVNYKEI
jgi:hypothetical protein